MSSPNPYENIPPTQYPQSSYSPDPYAASNAYPPAGPYGQQQQAYGYMPQPQYVVMPGSEPGAGLAVAGMILGIISLVAWFFYIGLITSILGIIFSSLGRRSVSRQGMAVAGLVTSIIGLVLSLIPCILVLTAASSGWWIHAY